ncbi:cell division protein CrgA [Nitriliruptoraceae bacterium ZYF776]|nr:cell division protein CrgA [Profundirhabdus halotolerans]
MGWRAAPRPHATARVASTGASLTGRPRAPPGTRMPKSKHRRKGQQRKRAYQQAPPPKNPTPSAPWVPIAGVALLLAGVAVILLGYLVDVTASWPPFGQNWGLVAGFALLITGFVFLTRWR